MRNSGGGGLSKYAVCGIILTLRASKEKTMKSKRNLSSSMKSTFASIVTLVAVSAIAEGPAVTNYLSDGSIVHIFTNTTSMIWTVPHSGTAEMLLVGGGGGGGVVSGGGGGGGQVVESSVAVVAGQSFSISVGAGGVGSWTNFANKVLSVTAQNGGNSSISGSGIDLIAIGGGAGGSGYPFSIQAASGASGGGAFGWDGNIGAGLIDLGDGEKNDGAPGLNHGGNYYSGGGGGGAGGKGIQATTNEQSENGAGKANGGVGIASDITGETVWYGGGGGGGTSLNQNRIAFGGIGGGGSGGYMDSGQNKAIKGENGADGFGGGGGGGGRYYHHNPHDLPANYSLDWSGGKGGDGVVIIRIYPIFSDSARESGIGGTITKIRENGTNYVIHTFLADGVFSIGTSVRADVLIVGGGGAGGPAYGSAGGGGGGGGVIYTNLSLVAGVSYPVVVGTGGVVSSTDALRDGGKSIFCAIDAIGGGGGGRRSAGRAGGSGGGGSGRLGYEYIGGKGIEFQGHDGGTTPVDVAYASGGGGAGADGQPGVGDVNKGAPGCGGDGVECFITGASVHYGGGGAGGASGTVNSALVPVSAKGGGGMGGYTKGIDNSAVAGTPGVDGLGGGGGGGGMYGNITDGREAAKGGSGVVIVRYALGVKGLSIVLR